MRKIQDNVHIPCTLLSQVKIGWSIKVKVGYSRVEHRSQVRDETYNTTEYNTCTRRFFYDGAK